MNEHTNYGDVCKADAVWQSQADVSFMDYGGSFVREDELGNYNVIVLENMAQHDSAFEDAERKYYLAEAYVDLDDDWIDYESVGETYGISIDRWSDEYDPEELAYACVGYYGAHEFSGCECIEENLKTYEEVMEILKAHGIAE